jgi:hypothetical protein
MDWGSLGHQSLDVAEIPHLGCFPLVCLSFGGIIISMLEEIKKSKPWQRNQYEAAITTKQG